jgi:hypothetical protein
MVYKSKWFIRVTKYWRFENPGQRIVDGFGRFIAKKLSELQRMRLIGADILIESGSG